MKNKTSRIVFLLFDNLIWILVIASLTIFSVLSESFRTPYNLVNILSRTAALGMLVIGQAFTMITSNFDLSSESGLGLTAMVAGLLLAAEENGGLGLEVSPVLAIAAMIAVGLAIGIINGFLITRLRMNNLIVTIAMLMILRGLVYIISPGATASFFPDGFLNGWAQDRFTRFLKRKDSFLYPFLQYSLSLHLYWRTLSHGIHNLAEICMQLDQTL